MQVYEEIAKEIYIGALQLELCRPILRLWSWEVRIGPFAIHFLTWLSVIATKYSTVVSLALVLYDNRLYCYLCFYCLFFMLIARMSSYNSGLWGGVGLEPEAVIRKSTVSICRISLSYSIWYSLTSVVIIKNRYLGPIVLVVNTTGTSLFLYTWA